MARKACPYCGSNTHQADKHGTHAHGLRYDEETGARIFPTACLKKHEDRQPCIPHRRSARKGAKNLAARVRSYNDLKQAQQQGRKRPGSLKKSA